MPRLVRINDALSATTITVFPKIPFLFSLLTEWEKSLIVPVKNGFETGKGVVKLKVRE